MAAAARFMDMDAIEDDAPAGDETAEEEDAEDADENGNLKGFIVDDEEEAEPAKKRRLKKPTAATASQQESVKEKPKRRKRAEKAAAAASAAGAAPVMNTAVERRDLDAEHHSFMFEVTNAIAVLGHIVDMMKINDALAELNMIVEENELKLYTMYHTGALCILAQLNREFFHFYKRAEMDGARVLVLNIATLAQQFARLKSLDAIGVLVRSTDAAGIEIKGFLDADTPMVLTMKECATVPFELPPFDEKQYPITIQLDAALLCKAITQMIGNAFTIRMDVTRSVIVLYSESDAGESFEMPIRVGAEENELIRRNVNVAQFHGTFHKSYFLSVIKAQKLNNMARVSFMMEDGVAAPLRIQYAVKSGDNFDTTKDSIVSVYIGTTVDE